MKYVFGFAVLAFAIYVLVRLDDHRKNRRIEAAFAGRERLSPELFYARFFADNGIPCHVVQGVREILEEQLGADMSRLTDKDDFSKNLRFFWEFDSMADVEIICALEDRFSIRIEDAEAERTRTVRDMIDLVCGKIGMPHA
jgi:acyl carrier protein